MSSKIKKTIQKKIFQDVYVFLYEDKQEEEKKKKQETKPPEPEESTAVYDTSTCIGTPGRNETDIYLISKSK